MTKMLINSKENFIEKPSKDFKIKALKFFGFKKTKIELESIEKYPIVIYKCCLCNKYFAEKYNKFALLKYLFHFIKYDSPFKSDSCLYKLFQKKIIKKYNENFVEIKIE